MDCNTQTETLPNIRLDNVVILIALENTICKYDEQVLVSYQEKFTPKRSRTLQTLRHYGIQNNYASKERQKVHEVRNEPGFWRRVEPFPGVVQALKEMRGHGADVRIFSPINPAATVMSEIVEWVDSHFEGSVWSSRLIFCSDKTFLTGDFLIDSDPDPCSSAECVGQHSLKKPSWSHVLFDRPYNTHVRNGIKILTDWSYWKNGLGLDTVWTILPDNKQRPNFIHGSPDSKDCDRDYLFDEMPPTALCHMFCQGVKDDRNLIVVDKNLQVIVKAHKGNPDECNNALLSTYPLHKQNFPCPVARKVTRVIPLKVFGTLRKLVGALAEYPPCREEAKRLMKDLDGHKKRVLFISKVNFHECWPALSIEVLKMVAFQLAQSLALMEGSELYTKQDTVLAFPSLHPFLYRKEHEVGSALSALNECRDSFVSAIQQIKVVQSSQFLHLSIAKSIQQPWLPFKRQCNGMILSTRGDLVAFPFDHGTFSSQNNRETIYQVVVTYWMNELRVFDEHGDAIIVQTATELLNSKYNLSGFRFSDFYYVFCLVTGSDFEARLELIGTRCRKTYDQVIFDEGTKNQFKSKI